MSQRMLRVRELMKRELSQVIQRDYEFHNVLVTINDVDVTPDLRQAHVFVSMLGDEKAKARALARLQRDAGQLQVKVSKRVVLRYTPHLNFKLDDSIERGVRILSVIQGLDEEDAAKAQAEAAEAERRMVEPPAGEPGEQRGSKPQPPADEP